MNQEVANCAEPRRSTRGGIQRLAGVVCIVSADKGLSFESRGTTATGVVRFFF